MTMRSTELVIAGVLLVCVAVVPSGWQDRRFSRFLGGDHLVVHRRSRGRRARLISALSFVSGVAFVLVGLLVMLR